MSRTGKKKECVDADEHSFEKLKYIQMALEAEAQVEGGDGGVKEKPLWSVSVRASKRDEAKTREESKTIDPVVLDRVEAAVRDLALCRKGTGSGTGPAVGGINSEQQQRNAHSASPRGVRDNRIIGGFGPRVPVRSKSSQAVRRLPDRSGSGTLARRAPNRTRSAQVVRRLPDRKGSGRGLRRAVPERNSSTHSLRAFRRDRVDNPLVPNPLVERPLYKVGSDCDDSVLSDLDSCYTMDSINIRNKSQIMHDDVRIQNDDESETMTDGESVISFNTLDSIVLRRLQIHNLYDEGAAAADYNGSISTMNTTDVQQINAAATFDFETLEEIESDNDDTFFQEGVFTIQESEL